MLLFETNKSKIKNSETKCENFVTLFHNEKFVLKKTLHTDIIRFSVKLGIFFEILDESLT